MAPQRLSEARHEPFGQAELGREVVDPSALTAREADLDLASMLDQEARPLLVVHSGGDDAERRSEATRGGRAEECEGKLLVVSEVARGDGAARTAADEGHEGYERSPGHELDLQRAASVGFGRTEIPWCRVNRTSTPPSGVAAAATRTCWRSIAYGLRGRPLHS